MKRITHNQNGFGAIEILLLLILIALVVFVGFYIAHNHKNNTVATLNTKSSSSSSSTSQKYFTITQWGVRAPYNGSLTLEYSPPSGNGGIYLSSVQLDNSNQQCALNQPNGMKGGYGGYIARYTANSQMQNSYGQNTSQTAAQYYNNLHTNTNYVMAHVGSYYYFYTHPQGLCAQNSVTIQNQTESAFQNIVKNLQPTS